MTLLKTPTNLTRVANVLGSTRLVVVVMGWSLKDGQREGYLIEYTELFGNTAYDDVWTQLEDEFLYREFNERSIIEMGVDSGYNPSKFARSENRDRNIIYDFCRKHRQGENHVLDCVVINYFLTLKNRRLFTEQSPHQPGVKTVNRSVQSEPPPGWD